MERKLRFFTEIEEHNKNLEELIKITHMDELVRFDKYEKQILEMNTHQETLHRNYQLVELKHIRKRRGVFSRLVKEKMKLDLQG